ncbi:MAG TPA: hypothetical protein VG122_24925 [Gemmata sp.]|nr:hypothetical protein [Gemmata sp.]
MHAAALLTAMVTHGLIMPPVEKHRGYHLEAARPWYAIEEFRKIPESLHYPREAGSGITTSMPTCQKLVGTTGMSSKSLCPMPAS